jgi:hypothetical protein
MNKIDSSLHIVGGIVASGVFLLFIAVAGLYGAVKHHQVPMLRFFKYFREKKFGEKNCVFGSKQS